MMIWIRRLIIIRNCCSVGVASSTLQFRRCLWTLKYYFFIHSIESLYRGSNSFHMHAMILVRWTLQEMKVFLTYNCQSNILAYIIFDLILHKWKKKKKRSRSESILIHSIYAPLHSVWTKQMQSSRIFMACFYVKCLLVITSFAHSRILSPNDTIQIREHEPILKTAFLIRKYKCSFLRKKLSCLSIHCVW